MAILLYHVCKAPVYNAPIYNATTYIQCNYIQCNYIQRNYIQCNCIQCTLYSIQCIQCIQIQSNNRQKAEFDTLDVIIFAVMSENKRSFSIDGFPDLLQVHALWKFPIPVHFCRWSMLTWRPTWKPIMNSKCLPGNIDQYFPHTRRTIPLQNNTMERCHACQSLPTLHWDPFCIFCNKCIGMSNIWIRSQWYKDNVKGDKKLNQLGSTCNMKLSRPHCNWNHQDATTTICCSPQIQFTTSHIRKGK